MSLNEKIISDLTAAMKADRRKLLQPLQTKLHVWQDCPPLCFCPNQTAQPKYNGLQFIFLAVSISRADAELMIMLNRSA